MNDQKSPSQLAAATLGRLSKGVPKTITESDRQGRRERMEKLNQKRAARKAEKLQRKTDLKNTITENAMRGVFVPTQKEEGSIPSSPEQSATLFDLT